MPDQEAGQEAGVQDSPQKREVVRQVMRHESGTFAPGSHIPGSLRHGGYSKQFKKRYSDARTVEGRQLRDIMRELEADLGKISPGKALILGRVREKLIVLMQIGAYVDKQPSVITEAGELLPCLGRGYTAYSEALRRDVELLYVMAKRTPSRVPDLAGYLSGKRVKA